MTFEDYLTLSYFSQYQEHNPIFKSIHLALRNGRPILVNAKSKLSLLMPAELNPSCVEDFDTE